MADIVNLGSWKKRSGRAAGKALGDQNAARFGRSKALKTLEKARADKDRQNLDALRLEGRTQGTGDETPGES